MILLAILIAFCAVVAASWHVAWLIQQAERAQHRELNKLQQDALARACEPGPADADPRGAPRA